MDFNDLIANGYVFLPQFRPGETALSIANEIGTISAIPSIPIVQRISPKEAIKSTPNVYSGNFGLDAFPLHTDLAHWHVSPRFIVLRCVEPAPEVSTFLLPFSKVIETVDSLTIERALFRPRRKCGGRLALLRLRQEIQGSSMFRWDELFLKPSNVLGVEVAKLLKEISQDGNSPAVVFSRLYDTLVIDNWSMLHGRSIVPSWAVNRTLDRVYLRSLKNE